MAFIALRSLQHALSLVPGAPRCSFPLEAMPWAVLHFLRECCLSVLMRCFVSRAW